MKHTSKIIIAASAACVLAIPLLATAQVTNPLGEENNDIPTLLTNVIQFLLGISAFLVTLALIYGGIRLITAAGNDQYVQLGKQIIMWAIAGLVIILLSLVIIQTISGILGA